MHPSSVSNFRRSSKSKCHVRMLTWRLCVFVYESICMMPWCPKRLDKAAIVGHCFRDWLKQHEAVLLVRVGRLEHMTCQNVLPMWSQGWLDLLKHFPRPFWRKKRIAPHASHVANDLAPALRHATWLSSNLKPFLFAFNGNDLSTTPPPLSAPCFGAPAKHQCPWSSQKRISTDIWVYRMMPAERMRS